MMGPHPNSLGAVAVDFFPHGAVAYAGSLNVFAYVQICLAAGFGLAVASLGNWNVEDAVAAGSGSLAVAGGFSSETSAPGGVPECD